MEEIQNTVNKYQSTKTINNTKYTINKLKMTDGLKTSQSILKLIAPTIGGAVDGLRHDEVLHGAPDSFANLALLFTQQMDKVDIIKIIHTLLFQMEVNGKSLDPNAVEDHFIGNYGELVEVVEFALEENFKSFFAQSGIKARFTKVFQTLVANTGQDTEEQ